MDWGSSRWDPHDDWKGCGVLLYNVHMVRSPYFGSESTVPTCISANAPPANFINYRFFSISCLLAISKRFGLPELLQSACKIVIATANNVQTTLASFSPRLTDKRLFVFGAGRYNCEGVPCFLRHPGVYHV